MISVTDPVSRAVAKTREVLFTDFRVEKWLILGFCAFLAGLGEGGSGGGGGLRSPAGGGDFAAAGDWIIANIMLVIVIAIIASLVFLGIGALLAWLSSRGFFMFIDGVVRNRAAVAEPWREYRSEANSLFLMRFVILVAWWAVMILAFVVFLVLGWGDMARKDFGGGALLGIILAGGLMAANIVAILLLHTALKDFVSPIMYIRRTTAMEGLRVFWQMVLTYPVELLLYLLLRIVLAVVCGVVVLAVSCVTCCIAALPYVSSVVFLPFNVFFRAWPLYFLEQMGEDWRFFEGPEPEEQTIRLG